MSLQDDPSPDALPVSPQERRAWISAIVAVLAYATYLALILGTAGSTPLPQVPYGWTLVWSVVGAIVVTIVLNIGVGILTPRAEDAKDERDREIDRLSSNIGQAFVVIGAVSALVFALLRLDYFWIANVVYLCFVLSALLQNTARIVAYRRGFQTW